MSCLERCPQFRGVFIPLYNVHRGFHCTMYTGGVISGVEQQGLTHSSQTVETEEKKVVGS